jgi:ATP-dependent Lhr-like helicase
LVALARSQLDRYGVVVREVAQAEALAGGFSAIYPVLKAMEQEGRVRRGYFVAGRGGAQFAVPGADEQLRASRELDEDSSVVVLAAVDPANPYGTLLPWPARVNDRAATRPQRAAGAWVLLWNGSLLAWIARGEQGLLTFVPDSEPQCSKARALIARGLVSLVNSRHGRGLLIPTIDGEPSLASPLAPTLIDAGFVRGAGGLLCRRMLGRGVHEIVDDDIEDRTR